MAPPKIRDAAAPLARDALEAARTRLERRLRQARRGDEDSAVREMAALRMAISIVDRLLAVASAPVSPRRRR